VTYNYNDLLQTLGVSVTQAQNDSPFLYELPLKTAVIYGNEKKIVDWNITKGKDTFTYAYSNGMRPVIIPDYTHVLPCEIKDNKKPEQLLVQYLHCDNYAGKRMSVSAAGKQLPDSSAEVIIDFA